LFVEKLFRTAQNRIFQMRTKQTERRERKNIKTALCRAKKRVKNYGDFYRV
jgi:hypothetical protein